MLVDVDCMCGLCELIFIVTDNFTKNVGKHALISIF